MLHDGFGNEVTANELVSNYWKWSHSLAWDYTRSAPLNYDDVVQEALIEIWRKSENHPEGLPANYLTRAARYRMIEVASEKRPMTGGDSTPGPKSRPTTHAVDWSSIAADPDSTPSALMGLLEAADVLEAVDWAYHHGEISQALNALPEADSAYVKQRFWEGLTDTEIAALRGVDKRMLGNRWKRTIRPKLVEALAHLSRT